MKPLKIGDFQGQQVNLPEGKPPFSYRFPMIFPFSYGFPMVFQPVMSQRTNLEIPKMVLPGGRDM